MPGRTFSPFDMWRGVQAREVEVRWPLHIVGGGRSPEETHLHCPLGADSAIIIRWVTDRHAAGGACRPSCQVKGRAVMLARPCARALMNREVHACAPTSQQLTGPPPPTSPPPPTHTHSPPLRSCWLVAALAHGGCANLSVCACVTYALLYVSCPPL